MNITYGREPVSLDPVRLKQLGFARTDDTGCEEWAVVDSRHLVIAVRLIYLPGHADRLAWFIGRGREAIPAANRPKTWGDVIGLMKALKFDATAEIELVETPVARLYESAVDGGSPGRGAHVTVIASDLEAARNIMQARLDAENRDRSKQKGIVLPLSLDGDIEDLGRATSGTVAHFFSGDQ